VTPDLTVFVDMTPETAGRELGASLSPHFNQGDLVRQRQIYMDELPKLPAGKVKIIGGSQSAEAIFPEVLAAVRSALA
jgi:thymidylate kinase